MRRLGAILLAAVLLAGCSAAASPASSTSPESQAPTSSSASSEPSASLPPASGSAASTNVDLPTARPAPSPSPRPVASGLPAGWHHELVCDADSTGCQLHLYDVSGREQPGWPRDLVGGCWSENVAVGTDGLAYVACRINDEQVLISGVDVSGATLPGWPIRATGYPLRVEVGRDGTVYFGTVNEAGDGVLSIHAFGPDAHPRSGWPTVLPRSADFAIAPDGTIVAWWYEDVKEGTLDLQAARTKYTMIGPDGKTLPGRWPITSTGTASVPVVTKDDSLFYTSATGKVWGHDRSGDIIDGWPYRLPYGVPPELRPDGLLMFIVGGGANGEGTTSNSAVIVLTTAGREASGWPYRTSASLDGPMCCTDCFSYFPHVSAADGTLYIAPWDENGALIVALDGRGRIVTGWPYRLPPGSRATQVEIGSARRLVVTLDDCSAQGGCCGSDASRQITLTPAGQPAP